MRKKIAVYDCKFVVPPQFRIALYFTNNAIVVMT